MTVIFLLLLAIRLLWKDESLFDIGAMYFGYLAVGAVLSVCSAAGEDAADHRRLGTQSAAAAHLVGNIWKG